MLGRHRLPGGPGRRSLLGVISLPPLSTRLDKIENLRFEVPPALSLLTRSVPIPPLAGTPLHGYRHGLQVHRGGRSRAARMYPRVSRSQRARSSAAQSSRLITDRSQVRILAGPPCRTARATPLSTPSLRPRVGGGSSVHVRSQRRPRPHHLREHRTRFARESSTLHSVLQVHARPARLPPDQRAGTARLAETRRLVTRI